MHEPVLIEVFRHRMSGVAEAMGASLQRAAYSANIKERQDHSCAVFDRHGRLLAQAAHIPVHLGAMPAAVAAARRRVRCWLPGDVVVLNDPFLGGSHLPDITTVSPVFAPGRVTPDLFVATRAHHADVGGAAPGSLPAARDLFGEGLVLPPVRIAREGILDDDLVAVICANSRTPDERAGDLAAQLAAHRTGADLLAPLLSTDRHGVHAAGTALLAYSARRAREALARLPEGRYVFADYLDDDGAAARDLRIRAAVTIAGGDLTVDFAGTAPQVPGGVNAPRAVTVSAVYYVVACLLDDVPINAGAFSPVHVHAPRGSLVNPRPPAAVAGGNVETSQRIVDVVLGALALALPERIPAASQGTMNNVIVGGIDPRTDRPYTYYETVGGGAGASPTSPGASGVQVHMTNTRNTPVEALETAFPLRVEHYGLRRGSGGSGRRDGGDGIVRCVRCLAGARVSVVSERRARPPWGLEGGGPGLPGVNVLSNARGDAVLPAKSTFDVEPGDVVTVCTPGGGGWGAPTDRSCASPEQWRSRGEELGQQVQDEQEREHPTHHGEQQRSVGQEHVLRRAPLTEHLDEVQVAEHSVEDERDGEEQHVGRHADRAVGRGDGVERVGDDGGRRGDHDEVIEKVDGVRVQARAMLPRRVGQEGELVPALGEALEEREEDHREVEVRRDGAIDRHAPGQDPEHEAPGDRQDLDDHQVLERDRVGKLKREVRQDHRAFQRPDDHRAHQRARGKDDGDDPRERRADLPRGQWAEALRGMPPILFDVRQVVQEVDRARRGAERGERPEGGGDVRPEKGITRSRGEDERREHERVLRPLARSECDDDREPGGPRAVRGGGHGPHSRDREPGRQPVIGRVPRVREAKRHRAGHTSDRPGQVRMGGGA
jgi:N-methylhydantoinase B